MCPPVFEFGGSGERFPHEFIASGRVKTEFAANLSTIIDPARSFETLCPIHSAFFAVSGSPTTGLRRWGD
jgi:hypothetical protein